MVGSLAIWRHYNKKIERLEKTQELFAKVNGIDEAMMWRIRRLTMYKYCSLFVALLSCGYTIKHVVSLLKKENVETQKEAPPKEESNIASSEEGVTTPTAYYYLISGSIFKYGIAGLPNDGKEHYSWTWLNEKQMAKVKNGLTEAFSNLTKGQVLFDTVSSWPGGKAATNMSWSDFDRELRNFLGNEFMLSDMARIK